MPQFFSWLEKNTEANVYYQSFALASGHQVTLGGIAATEADVNQQVAIFENAPEVSSVTISNVDRAAARRRRMDVQRGPRHAAVGIFSVAINPII